MDVIDGTRLWKNGSAVSIQFKTPLNLDRWELCERERDGKCLESWKKQGQQVCAVRDLVRLEVVLDERRAKETGGFRPQKLYRSATRATTIMDFPFFFSPLLASFRSMTSHPLPSFPPLQFRYKFTIQAAAILHPPPGSPPPNIQHNGKHGKRHVMLIKNHLLDRRLLIHYVELLRQSFEWEGDHAQSGSVEKGLDDVWCTAIKSGDLDQADNTAP